jgi:hypothetical protein
VKKLNFARIFFIKHKNQQIDEKTKDLAGTKKVDLSTPKIEKKIKIIFAIGV